MAYARLGTTLFYRSEMEPAAENMRKAYELRHTVSERERSHVDSHCEMFVTGDLGAARPTSGAKSP